MAQRATFTGPGGQRKAFDIGKQPAGWVLEQRNPLLVPQTPIQSTTAEPTSSNLIQQIVESLYPKTPAPPSFENSGLYNESDAVAQANADYQPTFGLEQQRLEQQQQKDQGTQLSDYYNRGLSRSGGLVGAQQNLQQNQAFDTNALQQTQKSTLAGVKSTAYQNAFQRYLNQFNIK